MAKSIMQQLKDGMSCTKLSEKECKVVDGKAFVDKNGVKRACATTPILLSDKQWCRDRIVL